MKEFLLELGAILRGAIQGIIIGAIMLAVAKAACMVMGY